MKATPWVVRRVGAWRRLGPVVAILLILASPTPPGAEGSPAPLSATEKKLVKLVDAGNPEALSLLERVVDINSGTHHFAGVREVGKVFQVELEQLGFQARWIDGAEFGRAGHLIADHPGAGPRLLLIGHLDTVFEPDSPFRRFERLDPATARGPGVIDMKGGDVILLFALKALDGAGLLKSMNLVVVMTGDEEEPGRPLGRAREALVSAAKGAAFALGFEDGDGDPRHAVVARRGSTSWRLQVKGTPAHSSQIFREDVGPGAIFEAARILEAFRVELAGEAHLTFNPGAVVGGTNVDFDPAAGRGSTSGKNNVVAGVVEVGGDLRALSGEQFEKAETRMREIVAASLPHTEAQITFDEGYPPLAPRDGNLKLLALYDQASRDLGFGPVTAGDPDRAGAADVAYVASEVPMILDAIGLKGRDDHTPGETADLATLPIQTKRAALLLHRLSRTKR